MTCLFLRTSLRKGRRDVQGSSISGSFLHFNIADKSTNQAVDGLWKLQPEEMLHKGMSSNILFRDFLSFTCLFTLSTLTFLHSRDSVGHSGPLGPGLSSSFSSLLSPLAFTAALTRSVIPAHSVFGFLPLALLLSIIFTFFHSLDSVGHSGPLGLWLPLHLFSLLSSWFLGFPTTALTQSVIPAHSVSGNLISLSFFSLSLFFFTLACTQSVIPAHSVTGYLPPLVLFPFHWTPFSQSHHPVGHSGPLGYWLHLGLSTSFWFTSLSTSYPIPSLPCRSFRPTRQLTSSSP